MQAARVIPIRGSDLPMVIRREEVAPTPVASDATAFAMRRKHFMLEIAASWELNSQAEGDVHNLGGKL